MTSPESSPSDPSFTCPRCRSSISLANIRCPVCGVNLAVAVGQAAREMLFAGRQEVWLPYEADKYLPRFGEFLVKSGDITDTQLQAALERQKTAPGSHRTIGQILLEMGAVNRDQLDRASMAQIKQLQDTRRENKEQLANQARRIKQLEAILAELADFNRAAIDFAATVSDNLRKVHLRLGETGAAPNDAARVALADLEKLIDDLSQFVSGERG
ncbi:MAG TPA: hypothetical protein VJL59_08090 [Anaerolineales bacterium]|nr:hypothetical protein [Anaerolineales bacterium]